MTDVDTASQEADENKLSVDLAKLLETDEVRDAFKSALEGFGKAGADLTDATVTFIIVATDANGWTGATDTGEIYLDSYQVEEVEPTAAEAETPATED